MISFYVVLLAFAPIRCDRCEYPDNQNPLDNVDCLEQQFSPNQEHKSVVLLGEANVGKTVLLKLIADRKLAVNKSGSINLDNANFTDLSMPRKYMDSSNTIYYDCPGFATNSSPASEFASMYFLKKAIDYSSFVKFIVVIDYDSIKVGNAEKRVLNMARHITDVIKNFKKYRTSVTFVVTKVTHDSFDDNQVIRETAKFVTEIYKNNSEEHWNVLDFLDAFVEDQGSNVALVRSFEEGVKKADFLQQELGKVVSNIKKAKYLKVTPEDFGVAVVNSTAHELVKWLGQFDFGAVVRRGVKLVEVHFREKLRELPKLTEARMFLEEELLKVTNLLKELEGSDYETFTRNFIDFLSDYRTGDILEVREKFFDTSEYISAMIVASKNIFSPNVTSWLQPFLLLQDTTKNWMTWYDILIHSLLDKPRSYDYIQTIRTYHNIHSNFQDSKAIMKMLHEKNISQDTSHLEIDTLISNLLAQILSLALRNESSIQCSKQQVLIEAHFVLLSDVSTCPAKNIEIISYHTFFIDINHASRGEVRMSVVAPNWVIVGNRTIRLLGEDGKAQPPAMANTDGAPGHPGGNGGTFYGAGEDFSNTEHLTIDVSGGNGGPGQEAGYNTGSKLKQGPGGLGGHPGILTLMYFDNKPKINIVSKKGKKGSCKGNCLNGAPTTSTKPKFTDSDQLSILNTYLHYLLKHYKDSINFENLHQFYIKLSGFFVVQKKYDTSSFLDELFALEVVSGDHPEVFRGFYQSLLVRLRLYLIKFPDLSDQDKKGLSTIYTSGFSQISRNIFRPTTNLVMDFDKYFRQLKHQIGEKARGRLLGGDNEREHIKDRIQECRRIFGHEDFPKIQSQRRRNHEDIRNLLKLEEKRSQSELMENRRLLQEAVKVEFVLEVLEIVGSIVLLFENLGGTLVELASSSKSRIITGTKFISRQNMTKIEDNFLETLRVIDNYMEEKKDGFWGVLEGLEKMTGSEFKKGGAVIKEVRENLGGVGDVAGLLMLQEKVLKALGSNQVASAIVTVETIYVISNATNLNLLAEVVKKVRLDLKNRDSFGTYLTGALKKSLEVISDNVRSYGKELKTVGNGRIGISDWNIQLLVANLKEFLIKSLGGYSCDVTDQILEAMSTLMDIYDRIHTFQQQKHLKSHLKAISSPNQTDIYFYLPETQKKFNDISYKIISNQFLEEYQTTVNAFKQYAFPFAQYFSSFDFVFQRTPKQVLNAIERLHSELSLHHSKIYEKINTYLHETNEMTPFFIWSNHSHYHTLSQLLAGRVVLLNSNIHLSPTGNSIKFKKISLLFQTPDQDLAKPLQDYHIEMKHLGNSYYRCKDEIYVISSPSQTFRFSYETDDGHEPLDTNMIYKKVQNGPYILSPYTMWEVRLIDVQGKGFEPLGDLKGLVDLELLGSGQSVDEEACELNLKKYYKLESVIEFPERFSSHC